MTLRDGRLIWYASPPPPPQHTHMFTEPYPQQGMQDVEETVVRASVTMVFNVADGR